MSSAIGIVTPLRSELDFALSPPVIPAPRSLEDFAYRFGRSYDSYLAADPKHNYILGQKPPWRRRLRTSRKTSPRRGRPARRAGR